MRSCGPTRRALSRIKAIALVLYKLQLLPPNKMPAALQQLKQQLPEPAAPRGQQATSSTQKGRLLMQQQLAAL